MPKKRKFASVEDKCRVCLSDEGCMSDIFSETLRLKINELADSTSISIDDDESFPRNICHVCLYKLDMWVDFKKQFVRSNAMLREHLELDELSDNRASLAKRKYRDLQVQANDTSVQQGNTKKLKSDIPCPSSVDGANSNLTTEKLSVKNDEQVVVKDSRKEAADNAKSAEVKEDSEITSDVIPATAAISSKVKQIVGRRTKTTERRMESTRRWVARKKALLAATGENDTDTDSMVSEDDQLSPVQKARAKCNAEKVAETHRRMTRALQNMDSSISGYYGTNADSESYVIQDSDSEARKEKKNCCAAKRKNPVDGGGEARLSSSNVAVSSTANNSKIENSKDSSNIVKNFVPQSVRSELVIDGETFVVTSTLVFSEPHYLNPAESNDSSLPKDEANQERNTDIIDAVQLRRVSPKSSQSRNENKLVDSCLNIEVEGTEFQALQRVQTELASFVEKDIKKKLSKDNYAQSETVGTRAKNASQTLEQQLKTIVETTIKKNLEDGKQLIVNRQLAQSLSDNRGNNTFTGEFLKAAMRSKIFQPRVLVVRYDQTRSNSLSVRSRKRKPIVIQEVEKKPMKSSNVKSEEPQTPLGKRRSVKPAKYADYNNSLLDSASEEGSVSEVFKKPPSGPKISSVKTYGAAMLKAGPTPACNPQKGQKSLLLPVGKPVIIKSINRATKAPTSESNNSTIERHVCGVCGRSFSSRKEVEIHFGTHKVPKKQKVMRCKRCHEIVEARYVKLHVCDNPKKLHKCSQCGVTFRSEQLLARHEESHESKKEEKIDDTSRDEATTESVEKVEDSPEIDCSNEKSVSEVATESRDSYTCFVCDKTFTDEELLKDHLQQHCDDMSEEDERSNVKEYQCAICGESLDSEDALETHVEKHLFDDEDDNPNLISIGVGDVDKSANVEMHKCTQCSENFDSEMLLMLHMQAHEEEIAIAEWERRGIDNTQEEQHICVICDDIFATEDDLSEHLDVHNGNAHICFLCEKPFLTLEDLQRHVNTH